MWQSIVYWGFDKQIPQWLPYHGLGKTQDSEGSEIGSIS